MHKLLLLLAALYCLSCNNATGPAKDIAVTDTGWQLVPFAKADSVNPILTADSAPVFNCPLVKGPVKWEEKDVINPAAITRNDTVFLLYRAEDKIGKYAGTSRIGIAWSIDGLHFTRHPVPVLYPAEDEHKKLEW